MTTNQKLVKVIVAQAKIKSQEIEGLILPDGTFVVSVSQVASLFVLTKSNATREVKALLCLDSSLTAQIKAVFYFQLFVICYS